MVCMKYNKSSTGIFHHLFIIFSHQQKGVGYHLDLLVVALLLGLCSVLGLPWFVAATVMSINHVNSLKVEKGGAPGEKPKIIGAR